VEPGLLEAEPASHFQFERLGYFFVDPVDSEVGRPVFNRVVTLRDSWAKQQSDTPTRTPEPKTGRPSATPSTPRVYRPEEPMAGARFDDYVGLGLGEQEASVLVQDAPLAALFAATHAAFPDAGTVAKWVVNQVPRVAEGRAVEALPFGGDELAQLLFLIDAGEISGRTGREVLEVLAAEGGSPRAIVEARGLGLIADSGELATLVDGLIAENPDKVAAYRGGKTGLMGFFVGQAMRVSGGKADPKVLQKLLADRLD
jgi:glutaminyl-tRNA synthetase